MPIEPPASRWDMSGSERALPEDVEVVGVGADLAPGTLLGAYRAGLFPMPEGRKLAWWSPNPRGILPLDGLAVSRSLRTSCRRFEIRVDTAFDEVVANCADHRRPGAWITPDIRRAYGELHRLDWAHSVEAWSLDDGSLAGGLYGVAVGGLFAGESMFHRATDASKVALVGLVERLADGGVADRLVDVQWRTDHLGRLGVVEVSRTEYHARLERALDQPLPPVFGGPGP